MNFLKNVGQKLVSMSYVWHSPATYLVFVPGISLLIQRVQMVAIVPLIPAAYQQAGDGQSLKTTDKISRKFVNICKWHLRGSLLQTLVFIALAMKTQRLSFPIFVIGILGTIELFDTAYKAFTHPVCICEFSQSGKIKSTKMTSALTIL